MLQRRLLGASPCSQPGLVIEACIPVSSAGGSGDQEEKGQSLSARSRFGAGGVSASECFRISAVGDFADLAHVSAPQYVVWTALCRPPCP